MTPEPEHEREELPQPDPNNGPKTFACDICGQILPLNSLAMVYVYGIETIACEHCREEEGL
jgi:hypothetical protein